MLIILTAATTLPVTLETARAYCEAPEAGDDDDKIHDALKAAIAYVEAHTSLVMAPTEFQYRLDGWPSGCDLELPRSPIRDVTAVEYVDEDGNVQTVAAANYSWESTHDGAVLTFSDEFTAPDLHTWRRQSFRVTFEAGYDDPEASGSNDDPNLQLPATAKAVILMLTEHWYDNRGVVSVESKHPIFMTADMMLAQLRVYR